MEQDSKAEVKLARADAPILAPMPKRFPDPQPVSTGEDDNRIRQLILDEINRFGTDHIISSLTARERIWKLFEDSRNMWASRLPVSSPVAEVPSGRWVNCPLNCPTEAQKTFWNGLTKKQRLVLVGMANLGETLTDALLTGRQGVPL